jgi:hypothetical protein
MTTGRTVHGRRCRYGLVIVCPRCGAEQLAQGVGETWCMRCSRRLDVKPSPLPTLDSERWKPTPTKLTHPQAVIIYDVQCWRGIAECPACGCEQSVPQIRADCANTACRVQLRPCEATA